MIGTTFKKHHTWFFLFSKKIILAVFFSHQDDLLLVAVVVPAVVLDDDGIPMCRFNIFGNSFSSSVELDGNGIGIKESKSFHNSMDCKSVGRSMTNKCPRLPMALANSIWWLCMRDVLITTTNRLLCFRNASMTVPAPAWLTIRSALSMYMSNELAKSKQSNFTGHAFDETTGLGPLPCWRIKWV